jgi:hypothetical protein
MADVVRHSRVFFILFASILRGKIAMDPHIKWAVMAQLRRHNPALPPLAKAGLAQRRLDTAIKVASDAYFAGFRDWAARIILAPPRR